MYPLLSVIQQGVIPWVSQPWHWAVSGTLIALTMFALLKLGKEFGVSSNLRTMCTIMGAGKRHEFFRINWKDQAWNLLFVGGAVIGGFIASHFMMSPEPVQISQATQEYLASQGVATPQTLAEGTGFVPEALFSLKALLSLKGLIMMVGGGFLIGFGTRWAGGCTSGHAISGLANLQLPSLIAVIGFFIGGLLMTNFLLPLIYQL